MDTFPNPKCPLASGQLPARTLSIASPRSGLPDVAEEVIEGLRIARHYETDEQRLTILGGAPAR
jgi:hypothetical protein